MKNVKIIHYQNDRILFGFCLDRIIYESNNFAENGFTVIFFLTHLIFGHLIS